MSYDWTWSLLESSLCQIKKKSDLLLTEYYGVVSKQQSEEGNERYNSL